MSLMDPGPFGQMASNYQNENREAAEVEKSLPFFGNLYTCKVNLHFYVRKLGVYITFLLGIFVIFLFDYSLFI